MNRYRARGMSAKGALILAAIVVLVAVPFVKIVLGAVFGLIKLAVTAAILLFVAALVMHLLRAPSKPDKDEP